MSNHVSRRVHINLILICNLQEIRLFNLCFLISGQFNKLLFKEKEIRMKLLIGKRKKKELVVIGILQKQARRSEEIGFSPCFKIYYPQ